MSEEEMIERRSSAFERHLQTGFAVIAISLMSWVGFTTYGTSVALATLGERVAWMGESMKELRAQLVAESAGRYTREDSQRDYVQYSRRFEAIESRLNKLEAVK